MQQRMKQHTAEERPAGFLVGLAPTTSDQSPGDSEGNRIPIEGLQARHRPTKALVNRHEIQLSEGSMAKLYATDNDDATTKEVGPRTNELLAG